jgi:hypothetical protein
MEVRKFDPTVTKQKELTLHSVFMIVGLAASESELNLHSFLKSY